jgi:transposase
LVTILQVVENLTDRQAAEAVQARIDGKYVLSLELTDPGFDFTVVNQFCTRLLAGGATHACWSASSIPSSARDC